MSATMYLIMLLLSVAILVLFVVGLKMHPFLALLLSSFFLGISTGQGLSNTINFITDGFGSTLGSIGLVVILGSILAMIIQDTGCGVSIVNFFITLFKGKNLELAPGLAAYIISIPVFADVTSLLLAPLSSMLAKRKKISMSLMGFTCNTGLILTHALVPPTPGILAACIALGSDLGLTIFWGILLSLIAYFVIYFVFRKWIAKDYCEPKEEFCANIEPCEEDTDYHELVFKEKDLPNGLVSFLPLLVPVLLITISSFAKAYLQEGAALAIIDVLGNKVVALAIGVIIGIFIAFGRQDKVLENANKASNNAYGSFKEVILYGWCERALKACMNVLLITAIGGGFSKIISSSGAAEELGNMVAMSSFPKILVPFLVTAIIMTAVGSVTTAQITSASIMAPLMSGLNLSPLACCLAIGAGSLVFSHVNNSGFWTCNEFFNLNVKTSLKAQTVPLAFGGILMIVIISVLNMMGLLG